MTQKWNSVSDEIRLSVLVYVKNTGGFLVSFFFKHVVCDSLVCVEMYRVALKTF